MDNYLDLAYGTIKQGKNGDWLKVMTVLTYLKVWPKPPKWYYATLLNLKSQMTKGTTTPTTALLSLRPLRLRMLRLHSASITNTNTSLQLILLP